MIKVIYTNTLNASKQESLFETQEQLEAHQVLHPQMYDNSYTEIIPGKDAVVDENGVVLEEAVLEQQIIGLKKILAPIKDFVSEGSLGFALSVLKTSEGLPPTIKEYFANKISTYLESENELT